jgi:hypothetical protein
MVDIDVEDEVTVRFEDETIFRVVFDFNSLSTSCCSSCCSTKDVLAEEICFFIGNDDVIVLDEI